MTKLTYSGGVAMLGLMAALATSNPADASGARFLRRQHLCLIIGTASAPIAFLACIRHTHPYAQTLH